MESPWIAQLSVLNKKSLESLIQYVANKHPDTLPAIKEFISIANMLQTSWDKEPDEIPNSTWPLYKTSPTNRKNQASTTFTNSPSTTPVRDRSPQRTPTTSTILEKLKMKGITIQQDINSYFRRRSLWIEFS